MSTLSRSAVLFPAIGLVFASLLWGQEKDPAQGSGGGGATQAAGGCGEECGPPYAISVSPDGSPISLPMNSSGVLTFGIISTGTLGATYTFSCSKTGGVTCGTVTPSSLFMAGGGDDDVVQVGYSVGTTSGTLKLTASGPASDIGSYSITALPQGPPIVAIRNRNDANWDRSECLVAGAGPAATVCGDLLVSHGMPGFSTLGRERSLTLVYSSHQAAAKTVVAAAVTTPSGYAAPTSAKATLEVWTGTGYVPTGSGKFAGWAPGTRQISVRPTFSLPTGAYRYRLNVAYNYPSGSYASADSGTLAVVNRSDWFGQGWSLAGVERLYFNQPMPSGSGLLWVGGEGSAKLYTLVPGTSTTWVAPPGAYRDTIVQSGGVYTRSLRHGVKVVFNSLGLHERTINRVGQTTWFYYTADIYTAVLDSVVVPPAGGTSLTYRRQLTGSTLTLTDPGNRVLTGIITSGRLTKLTDPDGLYVQFGYDTEGKMTTYRDRRGYTTTFAYASKPRLASVSVPDGPTGAMSATTSFEPWDMKGFAWDTTSTFSGVDTSLVLTKVLGPRPGVADDAQFWIDRWGAPTKIQDPLGHITTIIRDTVANPARVARVVYPNGRIVDMSWNTRGNLATVVDEPLDATAATTTYLYNSPSNLDAPSSVTDPDNVTTSYSYLSAPTALKGMLATVTAPNGHVTQFGYIPSGALIGQVQTVTEQNIKGWNESLQQQTTGINATTTFFYNAYGNIESVTTPFGRSTEYARDGLQRVIATTDPGDHVREVQYDAMNRITHSIQYANEFILPQLTTRYWYTGGLLDSVVDPRQVPRGYRYDARGRVIRELDDFGKIDSTFYNLAGLVDSVRTRRGHTIRFKYDQGGQLLEKVWSADYTYLADSITYTYDDLGRMLSATRHN